MDLYEVGIYNKYVRAKIRNMEEPPAGLEASWEDTNLFEIEAPNAKAAEESILLKYPARQGFVIDGVFKLNR
jgi:hypothetical protein|tara:strand:+ start:1651 stop:1866 length:216 start_codon:yes stop_codon:yes gene_type:complete